MTPADSRRRSLGVIAAIASVLIVVGSAAQQAPPTAVQTRTAPREGSGVDTLPDGVQLVGGEGRQLRVTPVKGLERPWALAFLPSGDMLVTERPGRLRLIRQNLTLEARPIQGIPEVLTAAYKGLMDIALHPRFADNRLVYFAYWKARPGEPRAANWDSLMGASGTAVLARGQYHADRHALTEVRDLFVAEAWTSGATAIRLAFARDGRIFMAIGAPNRDVAHGGTARVGTSEDAQNPLSHTGKVLRLNDDGTVPSDNPFVGRAGYKPEIYALGIRNPLGLMVHPDTGALWEADHGPMGGDEVNIITAGANYGWPVVSLGRAYNGEATEAGFGPQIAEFGAPGMTQPFIHWTPNIAPGGMIIYTGERFAGWKGHLLLGGLRSTQLHRVTLNARGLPLDRESLLTELKQRIREVRQGPDGLLYLLTDHDAGALLRVEPAR